MLLFAEEIFPKSTTQRLCFITFSTNQSKLTFPCDHFFLAAAIQSSKHLQKKAHLFFP